MPAALARSFTVADAATVALAGVLVFLVGLLGYRKWKESRVPPEERERQRRAELMEHGKMGDGNLVELREHLVLYSYAVRGVEYTASQDVAHLTSYLPAEISLTEPIAVRYDPRNPANSIVVSEQWSGLRGK